MRREKMGTEQRSRTGSGVDRKGKEGGGEEEVLNGLT